MTRIYITGCAKTGTTMVRRLFNAFDISVYNFDEITPKDFVKSSYGVGKRTANAVFSHDMPPEQCERQLRMLHDANIWILNVWRDRDPTLASDGGKVTPRRYDACMEQRKSYASAIAHEIKYEDLIADPDGEQQKVIEVFDLDAVFKWSDYPNFVDLEQESSHTHEGIYRPRPIGAPADPYRESLNPMQKHIYDFVERNLEAHK